MRINAILYVVFKSDSRKKTFYLLLYSYTQTNKYGGIITIDILICKEKPLEKIVFMLSFSFSSAYWKTYFLR